MAKKTVTIRDVARQAGVSVATASRAINGKDVVDPATRDRILSVMEELGFTPEPGGPPAEPRANPDRRRSRLVPHPAQAAERLRGVDAVLADSEFDLVIYNVESVQKRDHYLGRSPSRSGPTASSSCPFRRTPSTPLPRGRARSRRLHRRPHASVAAMPRVTGDDVAGGALAARHLLELGHRVDRLRG